MRCKSIMAAMSMMIKNGYHRKRSLIVWNKELKAKFSIIKHKTVQAFLVFIMFFRHQLTQNQVQGLNILEPLLSKNSNQSSLLSMLSILLPCSKLNYADFLSHCSLLRHNFFKIDLLERFIIKY